MYFVLGLVLSRLIDSTWPLLFTLAALVTFVGVAWHEAHPERGGEVGRPDISWPWRNRNLGE